MGEIMAVVLGFRLDEQDKRCLKVVFDSYDLGMMQEVRAFVDELIVGRRREKKTVSVRTILLDKPCNVV